MLIEFQKNQTFLKTGQYRLKIGKKQAKIANFSQISGNLKTYANIYSRNMFKHIY